MREPGTETLPVRVIVLLLGAFLPPLDFYIVNLALPAIRDGLQATLVAIAVLVTISLLGLSARLPAPRR